MRSLRPALFAAAASKAAGLGIQLVALPVAIKNLGAEAFGYYVALLAVTSWSSMFEGGLGIHLIKQLGHAQRINDYTAAGQIFRGGLKILTFVGLVAAAISVGVMLLLLRRNVHLNAEYLWLAVAVVIGSWLSLVLGFSLKVRVAFDQVHYNNLSGFAGNILALSTLSFFFLRQGSHSLILFYVSCVGSLLFANLVSVGWIYRDYRHLWYGSTQSKTNHLPQWQEMGYGFGAQLGILGERELPKVIFSLTGLLSLTGRYGVYVSLVMSLAGILTTVTAALSPRIIRLTVGDRHEDLHALWASGCRYILVASVCGISAAFFGGFHLVNAWLGGAFSASQLEVVFFAGWLCSIMWNHWNYTFISLGAGLGPLMRGHLFVGLISAACLGTYIFSGMVVNLTVVFVILSVVGWLGGWYFAWCFLEHGRPEKPSVTLNAG